MASPGIAWFPGTSMQKPESRNSTLDISVTRSGSPLLLFHWSLLSAAHWFCRRRAPLKAPSKASKHRWLASLANCHRLVPPNPCGNQRCTALPVHGTCTIGANSSSDPPSGCRQKPLPAFLIGCGSAACATPAPATLIPAASRPAEVAAMTLLRILMSLPLSGWHQLEAAAPPAGLGGLLRPPDAKR